MNIGNQIKVKNYIPNSMEENKEILIFVGEGKYDRDGYIKIVNDEVVFDCSDEEYGPIRFPLQLLKDKIKEYEG